MSRLAHLAILILLTTRCSPRDSGADAPATTIAEAPGQHHPAAMLAPEPRLDASRTHQTGQEAPRGADSNAASIPPQPDDALGARSDHAVTADGSIDSAMTGLLTALERKDVNAFLQYFSKTKPFKYIGTIEEPHQISVVRYEDLARDLMTRSIERGWYAIIFDGGPDDSLALTVASPGWKPWKQIGRHRFVPSDSDADSSLFVIWRREKQRWVVAAIGSPEA